MVAAPLQIGDLSQTRIPSQAPHIKLFLIKRFYNTFFYCRQEKTPAAVEECQRVKLQHPKTAFLTPKLEG